MNKFTGFCAVMQRADRCSDLWADPAPKMVQPVARAYGASLRDR